MFCEHIHTSLDGRVWTSCVCRLSLPPLKNQMESLSLEPSNSKYFAHNLKGVWSCREQHILETSLGTNMCFSGFSSTLKLNNTLIKGGSILSSPLMPVLALVYYLKSFFVAHSALWLSPSILRIYSRFCAQNTIHSARMVQHKCLLPALSLQS